MKRAVLIILLVLLADQALKVWVKLNVEYSTNHELLGSVVELEFIENPGMAFGIMIGGMSGKLILTLLRIVAVIAIGYALTRMTRPGHATKWQIISVALVFAGAMGNIIDSAFYGLIFDKGTVYDVELQQLLPYSGTAELSSEGYATFLHGSVVDMFRVTIWNDRLPEWIPVWGGEHFRFFEPVFNIADSSITAGIVMFLLAHRKKKQVEPSPAEEVVERITDDAPPAEVAG